MTKIKLQPKKVNHKIINILNYNKYSKGFLPNFQSKDLVKSVKMKGVKKCLQIINTITEK